MDAEKKAGIAADVLKNHLGFKDDEVEICIDQNKGFVDAKLNELKD